MKANMKQPPSTGKREGPLRASLGSNKVRTNLLPRSGLSRLQFVLRGRRSLDDFSGHEQLLKHKRFVPLYPGFTSTFQTFSLTAELKISRFMAFQ